MEADRLKKQTYTYDNERLLSWEANIIVIRIRKES